MAKTVQPRRRDAHRNVQCKLGHQMMEGLADGPRIDCLIAIKPEQWTVHPERPACCLLLLKMANEFLGHLGAERHQSALAEFALANEKHDGGGDAVTLDRGLAPCGARAACLRKRPEGVPRKPADGRCGLRKT